jgi:hypothetical protein
VGQGTNQHIKYWDLSASAYRFFAYASGNATTTPATEPAEVTVNNSDDTKVTFSAAVSGSTEATVNAAPYFSELWFSNDKANDYGQAVTLRFFKPFARVRFKFIFADGLDFGRDKLSNIKFYPTGHLEPASIPVAGDVTITYPVKGTATKESLSVTPTHNISSFDIDWYETPNPAVTPANSLSTTYPNTPNKWYYVLPVENQGTYTLEVSVVTNEVKVATIPAEFMKWQSGFEYTYIFKITQSVGVTIDIVQVAINNWEDGGSSTHTVYNW